MADVKYFDAQPPGLHLPWPRFAGKAAPNGPAGVKGYAVALTHCRVARALAIRDELPGRDGLVGPQFSVVNLNLAGLMRLLKGFGFDCAARANLQRWAAA